jgi:hypothetical protein
LTIRTEAETAAVLKAERKFLIPIWMERIIGKRLAFPINNARAKYYQKEAKGEPHS